MAGVRLISADEHVVVRTRTHAKVLVWPAVGLVVLGGLIGSGAAIVPGGFRPAGQVVVVCLGLLVVVWLVLRPFLRWATTTYTLTTHRLITRRGILHRSGKDLPLIRVNDVSYDQSLVDRMFGCGTLEVQTAGENGTIALVDVPDVEHVHAVMSELLFGLAPRPETTEPEWT
ncbi:PH domain-containing protein [Microlunatus ginsengisoli]|uniref:PH domain-containing protein n=1 Tax=Microlunatus ginsengisoli TaxID=363863 RepID=A0ABP6ZI88_9ACTN